MNEYVQTLLTIVGSGTFFGFIQFLVTRKDTKEKEEKEDRFGKIEKKLEEGLEEREKTGKGRYEEHKEAIEELRKIMKTLAENQEEQRQYDKCVGDVLMGLTQDKIVHLSNYYIKRGGITLDELAVLEGIYVPYHDGMHGNSYAKTGMEKVRSLPTLEEEKAKELDLKLGFR